MLPSRADVIYQQMVARVDPAVAMDTARMMAPRYETFANSGMGWEQQRGTLRLGSATGEVLLSRDTHHVALAIDSFSTPPGGAAFRLVDAGKK